MRASFVPELDDFTKSYIAAALWSTNGEDGEPLDVQYDASDIADEAIQQIRADCDEFQRENVKALAAIPKRRGKDVPDIAGYLFWMNRNGHGTGFWDETQVPRPAHEALDNAAQSFGKSQLYVGDDGKLYV